MKHYFFLLICLFLVYNCFTQDTLENKKTEFITAVTYQSALHYYGRTDSLKNSAFIINPIINFKNGLYLKGSAIFVINSLQHEYVASIAEAGYNFNSLSEKISGSIFATKYFYQSKVDLVQSVLKGSAGLNISFLNKILNLNAGSDVKLSDKLDYSLNAGLDHIFRLDNIFKGVILVDPSGYLYAGTQNFTNSFIQRKNFLIFPTGEQVTTEKATKFNILSYELSCPIIYSIKKIKIVASPSYVLPQNLIISKQKPSLSERGQNMFYIAATAMVTL